MATRSLAGEEISFAARIVSVADSFEVMTASRSYKKPMSVPAARRELAACAGEQFDPAIVRAFLNVSLGRLWWTVGPVSWTALRRSSDPCSAPVARSRRPRRVRPPRSWSARRAPADGQRHGRGLAPASAVGGDCRPGRTEREPHGRRREGWRCASYRRGGRSISTSRDGAGGDSDEDSSGDGTDAGGSDAGGGSPAGGTDVDDPAGTVNDVVNGVTDTVETVVDGVTDTVDGVVDGATDVVDGLLGTDVSSVVDEPIQSVTGVLGGLLGR